MTPLAHSRNVAARMGRWSAAHRKTAIVGWLAFVLVAVAIGNVLGTKPLSGADGEVGESRTAMEIVERGGFADTVGESVFVESDSHPASSAEFRAVVAEVVSRLEAAEGVSRIRSPLDDPALVAPNGRASLVQYELSDRGTAASDRVGPIVEAVDALEAASPGFVVDAFGPASGERSANQTLADDFARAEYTAVPLTLGILLVVFGALVAAAVPLLLGLSAVMAALGLVAIPSQVLPMDGAASSIILLIGLAVGVDYSLFYLRREREERAAGAAPGRGSRPRPASRSRAGGAGGRTGSSPSPPGRRARRAPREAR